MRVERLFQLVEALAQDLGARSFQVLAEPDPDHPWVGWVSYVAHPTGPTLLLLKKGEDQPLAWCVEGRVELREGAEEVAEREAGKLLEALDWEVRVLLGRNPQTKKDFLLRGELRSPLLVLTALHPELGGEDDDKRA